MSQRTTLEILDNNIAIVTLNRPEKYNGLDMEMFDSIMKTAKTIKKNKKIRGVILRGEGKVFSSGLDVKRVTKSPASIIKLLVKPGRKITNLAQDVGYIWRQLPVPVIAVTHGMCFGGAFQIALGADFRYTTPDCEFSIMEAKWGLIPDMSGSITLRELVPVDVAKELTMTARVFDGNEAKALGLVTKVSDTPFEDALTFFGELESKSPDAIRYAKQLFNTTRTVSDKEALDVETKLQTKLIKNKVLNLENLKALL